MTLDDLFFALAWARIDLATFEKRLYDLGDEADALLGREMMFELLSTDFRQTTREALVARYVEARPGWIIPVGEEMLVAPVDFDRVVVPGVVTHFSVRLAAKVHSHGFAGAVQVNVDDLALKHFVDGLFDPERERASLDAMSPRVFSLTIARDGRVDATLGREFPGDGPPRHAVTVGFRVGERALETARRGFEALLDLLLDG